jgi:hypothetical protein
LPSTTEAFTARPETSPRPDRSRRGLRDIPDWATLAITTLVVIAFAVWMVSPRFDISGPSVVDDWSNIDNAPVALDELARLSYDPAEVHEPRRYRPGYTAVWNSLQWHTFGGPDSMTAVNFWEIVRLALLMAALVAIVGFGLRADGRRRHPVMLAIWAAAPGAMLVATPGLAIDLARLGPVEPILVAGMGCGLALTLAATRRLIEHGRRHVLWLAAFAAGYALWLLGVYQKEASICALALLPFLYVVLDRRWRAAGVVTAPLYRSRGFLLVAALLTLPLLHMLYEVTQVTAGGETVYADVPSGIGGWAERLRYSADFQWIFARELGTFVWPGIAAAAPFMLLAWAFGHRRVPWLPLGLLAAGLAVYLFQGLGGVPATRYFIPSLALLITAAVILLADGPRWIQLAGVVLVALFLWDNVDRAHVGVEGWTAGQKDALAAVDEVARLDPARCPVYMARFHVEDADSYPELIALRKDPEPRPCDRRFKGIMVQGRHLLPPVTNEAIYATCAGPGWERLQTTRVLNIYGCRRFEQRPVMNQPPEAILRWNRLVPGQRLTERIESLPDQLLCQAAECRQLLTTLRENAK